LHFYEADEHMYYCMQVEYVEANGPVEFEFCRVPCDAVHFDGKAYCVYCEHERLPGWSAAELREAISG
jgi:hypothetical protein